ncbi:hypothetical protein [Clostridium sp. E02]|uniref:hypothetical protein n=1 Tax=Clostridium sp. E02 TaxID=2487134 RepID=UPI000F540808|nr:hypothetical protein [Clostridium sp. E02]
MIYTLNARNNVKLQIMKKAIGLSSKDIMEMICEDAEEVGKILLKKNISYNALRSVLTPPHKVNRRELAFCFDSNRIKETWYGNQIMKVILPLINKKRNHSILCGDMCVPSSLNYYVCTSLIDNIEFIKPLTIKRADQYFMVYINNLVQDEIKQIIEGLCRFDAFIGYGDMSYSNTLKDVLAYYLGQCCIQYGKIILLSHEDDISNDQNVNLPGYDFKSCGFQVASIQQYYYLNYLEYKIESRLLDKSDLIYCLNSISECPQDYEDYDIIVEPKKFEYIKNKNSSVIYSTGIDTMSLEDITELLQDKLKNSYIYNLEINDYSTAKFNSIIEINKENLGTFRLLASFEYNPQNRYLRLLNLF